VRWTLRDARGAAHFLRAEGYGVEADIVLQLVDATAEERAAIVAWLREEYDTDSTRDAADTIERGEHKRKQEP
jgi:hypothetical protein